MTFDAAAVSSLFAHVQSGALELGIFEAVNNHEPLSAPGNGIHAAVWVDSIVPVGRASGLAATSGVVTLMFRLYSSAIQKERDAIDPALLAAVSTLLGQYSSTFTFGGTVRNVDLLGMYGRSLSAQAGYLTQDAKILRIFTVTVPVVINDLWQMEA